MFFSTSSISSTNSLFGFEGSAHSLRGFKITKISAILGGIGSVATSGVPMRENTLSTSGNALIRCSSTSCISTDCSRPVEGILSAWTVISPSFSCGTNSLPSVVANQRLYPIKSVENETITQRNFNAIFSNGS